MGDEDPGLRAVDRTGTRTFVAPGTDSSSTAWRAPLHALYHARVEYPPPPETTDDGRPLYRQAGVLAWRREGRKLLVALISSFSGRRWVIPKGLVDEGETARESAARETEEEAGLRGELSDEPVGEYEYEKWGGVCVVKLYLMRVTEELNDWPEREARTRAWLTPTEASGQVREPPLRDILLDLKDLVRSTKQAGSP